MLDRFYLPRTSLGPVAALGNIFDANGVRLAATLEPPWRDNKPNESCVRADTYLVRRHVSPKFGKCFRLEDKHGRTSVLIHAGNFVADTLGCVLPGDRHGTYRGAPMVTDSRAKLEMLLSLLPEEFLLIITDPEAENE